jgi:serralysin
MAMKKGTFWPNGTHIKVAFMGDTANSRDASDFVKAKVQEKAKIWETYANIVFDFVDMSQTPDVRVSFGPNTGSWSYLGTECKGIDVASPTMNYGWFNDQTQDDEFERTAVHEFGHALGCTHELQSPSAGTIVWNKQAVYDYYQQNDGWDPAQVDAQVLTPDNPNNDIDTMFDSTSIMCYPIPDGLANIVIGWNKHLSPIDEDFIGESPYFLSYTSRYLIGISETSLPFSCVW